MNNPSLSHKLKWENHTSPINEIVKVIWYLFLPWIYWCDVANWFGNILEFCIFKSVDTKKPRRSASEVDAETQTFRELSLGSDLRRTFNNCVPPLSGSGMFPVGRFTNINSGSSNSPVLRSYGAVKYRFRYVRWI